MLLDQRHCILLFQLQPAASDNGMQDVRFVMAHYFTLAFVSKCLQAMFLSLQSLCHVSPRSSLSTFEVYGSCHLSPIGRPVIEIGRLIFD